MVGGVLDAVEGRVAQVDVGRRHVDLRAQHGCAVGQAAALHVVPARQVLVHAAAAERAVGAGRAEVATVGAHLLWRLLVDIGQAVAHQRLGRACHEVEVAAGVVQVAGAAGVPVEAEPVHRLDDGVDVLLLLLLGIGVVEAQVAYAAVVRREAEVQADALGVADVQVAVGLGREAGADAGRVRAAGCVVGRVAGAAAEAAAVVGAGREVALDDLRAGSWSAWPRRQACLRTCDRFYRPPARGPPLKPAARPRRPRAGARGSVRAAA
jgi:hypothetical protein